MCKKCFLFLTIFLVITFIIMPGCKGDGEPEPGTPPELPSTGDGEPTPDTSPAPSSTCTNISNQIAGIDPSSPYSLADLLGAAQDIEEAIAEGTVSGSEASNLESQLTTNFSSWIRETVDGIDPAVPESIKDFFDLQAVQRTSEYSDSVDAETKEYKEEQMGEKFNDWVRNRVDDIDPEDEGALKDMFDLQLIQRTGKYDELATADTQSYKEEQMGQKLNDWVRNQVDDIDPTDPDSLKDFFWMQKIQANEKYDKFATPETHEYKEQEMRRKFNEWVENQVNDLDPNDPDYLKKLEMLRVIQRSDKYAKFIQPLMHQWKERMLKEKMASYVTNLVNGLNPILPTFWKDLSDLTNFQLSDIYEELCPELTKQYKQNQLTGMLTKPLGPPPTVTGIYPEHEQADVPLDQSIMVVFDQPMDPVSLEAAIEVSPATLFDTIPLLEETFIVLLRPIEPLAESTTYMITINPSAASIAGMALLETYEFFFKTSEAGPAPNVIAIMPGDGTIDSMAGQPIGIKFNQRMLTHSVESAISIAPSFEYSVVWSGDDSIATIQSHAPLDVNTDYSVTIGTGVMSGNGVPLEKKFQFGFTTGIMNLPQVLGTLPDSGQENIPSNHPIQIVFDRSMDIESVEALLNVSPNFEYSTDWFEAEMVLEIKPVSPLPANTTYTITIGAGVLSSFSLPLEDDYGFSFTTRD
ncbi:hypothetical protein ES703_52237 [subsurface metagenome]